MVLYTSDPKNPIKEFLQLINTFSQVAGYKISLQKSVALLYTNDRRAEKNIMETTSFTIATNNIKYIWVTLTKQMKGLYNKSFKSLKREIKEDI